MEQISLKLLDVIIRNLPLIGSRLGRTLSFSHGASLAAGLVSLGKKTGYK